MSTAASRPTWPLLVVLLAVFGLVATVAWLDHTQPGEDPLQLAAPAVLERDLVFEPRADGHLLVVDAGSGEVVRSIAPEEESFVRGALRAVDRERHVRAVDPLAPLRLSSRADGAVLLIDAHTGVVYDLRAYGRTNLEAFDRLLRAAAGADDRLAGGRGDNDNLQTRTAPPARP